MLDVSPDLGELNDQSVSHASEARALKMLRAVLGTPGDMRPARGLGRTGDEVLDLQMLEAGVVAVEPDPFVAIERLAGVHEPADEVLMQECLEIVPTVFGDGGHESSKGGGGIHNGIVSPGTDMIGLSGCMKFVGYERG